MVLKSSDGEAKDGSSSEAQMTEHMETSTGIASSLLGKRKAESANVDSGESESDSNGDREYNRDDEIIDLEDSDSYWDKDSFDGREYHPSDDSERSDEDLQERVRFYNRRVIETKGFFEASDKLPQCFWAGISPLPNLEEIVKGITARESLANMASQCVEKYNKKNGKNVKLEHVLRVNFNRGGKTKYYITFTARESESSDEPLVEYQAKVIWCGGKTYPILCRPAPPPPMKS